MKKNQNIIHLDRRCSSSHNSLHLPQNLSDGWSKSIVLENKVVLYYDFRKGAKKSGHLDLPLQSYGQI